MLLYIRTFITMVVGLYTSRVMLNALGVDNYGINSVVGGIVSFSALITGTMAASSSRYLTYSLGEGVLEKMKNVFATVTNIQIVMGILAVIILEIVGVWFLNTARSFFFGNTLKIIFFKYRIYVKKADQE